MKRLLTHIALFLTPIVALLIFMPIKERSKFSELKDDCLNHGIWIHDRLYENVKPIDVVILGSSHTVNGIDDQRMEDGLVDHQLSVANLGYCRLGRNLTYTLLQKIIKTKDIKYLVLEVREDEDRYSHPIFPHISRTGDVVLANLIFNRDYLEDLSDHFAYKIELKQEELYHMETYVEIRQEDHGYLYLDGNAPIEELQKRKARPNVVKPKTPEMERNFHMQYPRRYLHQIHSICESHNIKILFLYMPSYDTRVKIPMEMETYQKYGKVLLPPMEIFDDQLNWYDQSHFNKPGAQKLSDWLADKLVEEINSSE